MSVILFHAGVPGFTGGFIGVDIFFVLSGFLITGIIDQGVSKNTFTFADFYLGRIRRLMPIYIVFLLVVTLFATLYLVPEDFIQYLKSSKYSMIFQSNSFFNELTNSYFSPSAEKLPLLHTWSLSIEWQFYLLWPVLFVLLKRLLGKKALRFSVVILFLVSLLWSIYAVSADSYYYFSTRIFELLSGAVTALYIASVPAVLPWLRNVISIIAMAVLILLVFSFTSETVYPGLNGFYVVAATSILIIAGAQGSLVSTTLSMKAFVFTGVLSYSLYLWHWPILAFTHVSNIELSGIDVVGVLLVSYLLSYYSWKLVETPFRYKFKFGLKKTLLIFWFFPTILFVGLSDWNKNNNGFPERFGSDLIRSLNAIKEVVTPGIDSCDLTKPSKSNWTIDGCLFGSAERGKVDVVLIGDSHARHFREFVNILSRNAGLSAFGLTAPACLAAPDIYRFGDPNYCGGSAINYHESVYKVIEEERPRFVIWAQNWMGYTEASNLVFNDRDLLVRADSQLRVHKAVLEGLKRIVDLGVTPIIIKPSPGDNNDQLDCFYQHLRERRALLKDECVIVERDEIKPDNAKVKIDMLFTEISLRFPQTIFIDPRDVWCKDGKCFTIIDGIPMFEDSEHINSYASRWLALEFLEKYDNPLLNSDSSQ